MRTNASRLAQGAARSPGKGLRRAQKNREDDEATPHFCILIRILLSSCMRVSQPQLANDSRVESYVFSNCPFSINASFTASLSPRITGTNVQQNMRYFFPLCFSPR